MLQYIETIPMAVLSPLSIPAAVAGPEQPALQARDTVISVCEMSVAVIGIGAMGGGIARALLRSDATKTVVGYDHSRDLVSAFHSEAREHAKAVGKNPPDTLGGALADDPSVVFLVLVNQAQCEEVCFGADCYNLLGLMKAGSCVVLCSTVTSIWSRKAREQFISKGIRFVDCPISGGAKRALSGELTMMASGDEDALAIARPLLDAAGKEVHIISGGAGMGQTVKVRHTYGIACGRSTISPRWFPFLGISRSFFTCESQSVTDIIDNFIYRWCINYSPGSMSSLLPRHWPWQLKLASMRIKCMISSVVRQA